MKNIKLYFVLFFSVICTNVSNGQTFEKIDSIGIVLQALYDSLGGDNWKHKDNWFSDKPYNEWYGLRFDVSGLYGIDLYDNNLVGFLPKEIGLLPNTVLFLDVRHNSIEGNIPVEVLDVPHMYLNIADNKFSGKFPEELKSASFYNEEWIYQELLSQKYGYGFDLPCTTNMIQLDDNIYLHPKYNAVECRLSKKEVEEMTVTNGNIAKRLIKQIYNLFNDEFDFISVIFNTAHNSSIGLGVSDGYFSDIKNDIKGIGIRDDLDRTREYGSLGRLSGIMVFNRTISAFQHEIMHNWGALDLGQYTDRGNNVSRIKGGHWGISDVNGLVGGFDPQRLKSNIDGNPNKYAYDGSILDFGSYEKYAPIELYLMGLIDIKKVPDIHVYEGITSYKHVSKFNVEANTWNDTIFFEADNVKTWTWRDIEQKFGKRNPSYSDSQKEFSILNLVITEKPVNDMEWQIIQDNIYLRSAKEDTSSPYVSGGSFWQVTGGLATVEMDQLNYKLKNPIVSNEHIKKASSIKVNRNGDDTTISSEEVMDKVIIYDINGKLIKNKSINNIESAIHLTKGRKYILLIEFKDGNKEVIKI